MNDIGKKKASHWVLAYGSDCDGYSSCNVSSFASLEEALESAEGSNEWSDGIRYAVIDKWEQVVSYCDDWFVDPKKYYYAD
jgi:hypothetical protein